MTETFTPEELKEHGINPIDEISWDVHEELRLGMDFHAGVTYITVPAKVRDEKVTGKGKSQKTEIITVDGLVTVTSDGRQFTFTKDNVESLGFAFPQHIIKGGVRRWSNPTKFLLGQETAPDPTTLHAGIRAVYEKYIEFAREEYFDILPLFVMGSYLFRLFQSLGYIHFNGTAASGKSQNLRILGALAFNTTWSSSMSAAALYRGIAGRPGVIAIDEAEGWEGERGEELRRILNAGYLDGEGVQRAERAPDETFQVVTFPTFGPKAIASIAPLDNVIGSRCLIVAMRPALRRIPEFNQADPQWVRIRDRLYLFAMYHADKIAALVDEWNEDNGLRNHRAPQLIGRQWQITQVYIVLADYLDRCDSGDRCDRLITFFNEEFAKQQKAQDATDRVRIVLKALPRVLAEHIPIDGGYYFLKDIHEIVSGYLEEDAKEYFKTRTLSKHLDVLGFKNKRSKNRGTQVWLDPETVRQEFRQRRVEPHDEDLAWLAGETNYIHTPSTPQSIWITPEEEEA